MRLTTHFRLATLCLLVGIIIVATTACSSSSSSQSDGKIASDAATADLGQDTASVDGAQDLGLEDSGVDIQTADLSAEETTSDSSSPDSGTEDSTPITDLSDSGSADLTDVTAGDTSGDLGGETAGGDLLSDTTGADAAGDATDVGADATLDGADSTDSSICPIQAPLNACANLANMIHLADKTPVELAKVGNDCTLVHADLIGVCPQFESAIGYCIEQRLGLTSQCASCFALRGDVCRQQVRRVASSISAEPRARIASPPNAKPILWTASAIPPSVLRQPQMPAWACPIGWRCPQSISPN